MIAFLDASALVYLLEAHDRLQERRGADCILDGAASGTGPGCQSPDLAGMQSRPNERQRCGDIELLRRVFRPARPEWLELTRDVVELAVAVRVRHGLCTPDALQAACCLQLGAGHVLLTGDVAFKRVAGLNVVLLT